jgi:hypothetical protein
MVTVLLWGGYLLQEIMAKETVQSSSSKKLKVNQVWWHTPIIIALRRLRQEDFRF